MRAPHLPHGGPYVPAGKRTGTKIWAFCRVSIVPRSASRDKRLFRPATIGLFSTSVASALKHWGSALLRCFPMCCSLPPSVPKAEAVELYLATPAMNGGGLGGGRLNRAAVAHLAVFLLVVALHSEPTC
jgi:hypothetical protein